MNDILDEIVAVVGAQRVLGAAAAAQRPTSFWNSSPMQAKAIVMPASSDEVAAILKACHARAQAVVIQGGLTNLVAGAVPRGDDVVLSMERMHRILDIDTVGSTAVVEAGAVLQSVQQAVAEKGLYFPLDLGARGSCTIGGNIATNAGGINVLRYGMMRNLVLGLEAVLADGTVVSSMNRMLKNNAGYDLKQLFMGSEGTLGVITKAVLRLFPQPASRQCALVALGDFERVAALLAFMRQQATGALSAFEIMWQDYYRAMTAAVTSRAPLARDYPFYVILQTEGADVKRDAAAFESALGRALEDGMILDAVIPKSESEARAIWEIREHVDEIPKEGDEYHYDVSLPIRAMPAYVDAVKNNVARQWPAGCCYAFGHVADGNLHFIVQPRTAGSTHHASDQCVYPPLADIGGSVSAEHGIGTERIAWLSHSRSAAEVELMRTLKRSLDPKNILNPGRVVAGVSQGVLSGK